jgi:hypothetical protein
MKDHKTKLIIISIVILLIAPTESVNLIHNVLVALQSLLVGLHLH